MFPYHSTLLRLFFLCIVCHLTPSVPLETSTDPHKTQYIVAYITSQSPLSPVAFETSFNVFSTSLRSVISDALPPTVSHAFNMTQINLWCLPANTDIAIDEIYSSFYIKMDINSNSLEGESRNINGNDILLPMINRMKNDLFPQLLLDHIATIDTDSPLIHPNRFKFQMYDVSVTPANASFIVSDTDCVSYLMKKRATHDTPSPPIHIAAEITNHDDDDFVQFLFYGFTVHWKVSVIWSALCIVIGMSICTACVCCHIDWMERRRKRRRKQKRKHERMSSRNSYYSDQTASCIGSTTDLTPITLEDDDIMIDGGGGGTYEEEDMIAIIRPKRTCTAISRRNYKGLSMQKAKSNSVTIDSEQSQLIRQQFMERQRRRAKSCRASCRGYDELNRFDEDEDMELKQEQLIEDEDEEKTEKIVTVHVHHHYNRNGAHSPPKEEKESYPDLPFDIEAHQSHYVAMNSPVSDHNIRHIMTLSHQAQKEPSKSQREGFSPFTVQPPQAPPPSQPEERMSDSELLYVPGPPADDTPGQNKTPHDMDIGISK